MTLLNMKNVIYPSSPNTLSVGHEHVVVYTRQALGTSISMHIYVCP
jgi:hypothetical protein